MSLPDIVEMSLDYLEKGGEVMIPLIGISFWMWFLIFKKLVELYVYRKDETPAPNHQKEFCLLYTSPSPRDLSTPRMPSSA